MRFIAQVLTSFTALLGVLGAAALIHAVIHKRRVASRLQTLAHEVNGTVRHDGPFTYPRLDGQHQGRHVSVSFRPAVTDAGRLTYLVLSTTASPPASSSAIGGSDEGQTPFSLVILKATFYRPGVNERLLGEQAGEIVPWGEGLYQVRSQDRNRAARFLEHVPLLATLHDLTDATGLVIGPDAVVATIPYSDLDQVSPDRLLEHLRVLDRVATALETQCST